MKRSKTYLGILIVILVIAQFIQMIIGTSVLYSWNLPQGIYSKILRSKTELLNDLESHQSVNKIAQDTFYTLKEDLYLLTNEATAQITWLEVETDSPKTIDSIQFYEYALPLEEYAKLSLMNFQWLHWVRDSLVKNNGATNLLSKNDLYHSVLKADKVQALVSKKSIEEIMPWYVKLFFSPVLGPLLLLTTFLLIWGVDKLSSFTSAMFKRPKWLILGLVFSLFTLWDTWRLAQIHFMSLLDKQLEWPILLSGQIIVNLLFIPGFFLFFYLKRKYFNQLDFADREAFKFGYIFILWSIFSLLHSYLGAQFFEYINPDTYGYQIWITGQIPAFALMLATSNFLNNFRKQYYQLKGKEKALANAQKNELQSESALAALQSRINPHFLYNALNSIASLAQEDAVKTEKMAVALSKFYKYSTNRKDKHWTTIAKELDLLETYLVIEKIRFGDQLIIHFDCKEDLKSEQIPRFLLQPLVENAIKYGYNEATKKNIVNVTITEENGRLQIKITDEGLPFLENMELGYGLRSVQKKLKLLYPKQHELDFVNAPAKAVVISLGQGLKN